jgi:hypothetical protein
MLIVPGDAPVVLTVAALPLPEMVPLLAVQPETETGTPSGLVQLQVTVTLAPACTLDGLAEQVMVGGFLGGRGFTVKLAEQLATLFVFSLASVAWAVTV